ncbi:MAG: DUF2961 domain-containing protein [Opitutaceae bacterium]
MKAYTCLVQILPHFRNNLRATLSSLAICFFATAVQAADIAWTISAITGDSDVVNTGTTVEAINGAATSVSDTLLVNGVEFTSDGTLLGGDYAGDVWTGSGTGDYQQLLSNIDFETNGTGAITVTTFTGLIIGRDYVFQYWYADDDWQNPDPDRELTLSLGAGTQSGDRMITGEQFATATFTADASTLDLIVTATHNGTRLTAYQLRVIPDPLAPSVSMESLLNEMVDRSEKARFPSPNYKLIDFSSYNRSAVTPDDYDDWFTNNDYNGKYLYDEDVNGDGTDEYVLVDHQSPGAIVRSWMPWPSTASSATTSIVRIYLDGSTTPVIEGNMLTLFDGTGLIPPPFAHESLRSAVSFFPISYAQSCKVTVSENPFFFIYTCREYENGTDVETFTMADYTAASPLISTNGSSLLDPDASVPAGTVTSSTTSIAAGDEAELVLPAGGRAVHEFEVEITSAITPQLLRSIIVKAEFDDLPTIWCPLSDFFGSGVGLHPFEGWYRTVEADGTFTCRWVMPYQAKAKLSLENLSANAVDVTMSAITDPWTWDERSMYFHSAWRSQYPLPTRPFSDWNYVTVSGGRGVFMGDTLTIWNPVAKWWGEGDHKIWVDDDTFPALFGTGTEDYYGYSWGGRSTDFYEHPFHGQVQCNVYDKLNPNPDSPGIAQNTYGYSVEIRSRGLDGIPFQNYLQLDMEIWNITDDVDMDYAVATHWYAAVEAVDNRSPNYDAALQTVWDETGVDPALYVSVSEVDFGFTENGAMATATVTVQNRGGGTLTGTVAAAAPFSVESGGSYSLATAETQDIVVKFSPTTNGAQSGTLTLTGADGASLALKGRGYTDVSIPPVLTLIADLRANYQDASVDGTTADFNSGEGLSDTDGTGRWNYFESDAADQADYLDGSNFELLVFDSEVGNDSNGGYRDPEDTTFAPIVADGRNFSDSIVLDSDKLAFHPGSESDEASVVARWTAGTVGAGAIQVSGEVRRGSTNVKNNVERDFYIFKGNAAGTSYTLLYEQNFGNVDTSPVAFDVSTSLAEGEHIDLVVNRIETFGADEMHIKAQIYDSSAVESDDDLDDLPDDWESQWASNLTDLSGSGDFDGDGSTDGEEWLAGSDPLDANDRFEVIAFAPTVNGQKITWMVESGKTYSIERRADLSVVDSWIPVATGLSSGAWLDTSPFAQSATNLFYRVKLEQ